MAGAIASLLPLLTAGFLFLYTFYRTRFIVATAEGQKLFFMSAAAGLLLGLFAFPAYRMTISEPIRSVYALYYPEETGPLALALLLSLALSGGLNFLYFLNFRRKYRHSEISTWERVYRSLSSQYGTPLQRLLVNAISEQRLVMVTLSSRKVYCGRVLSLPPAFKLDDQYIEIIPKFSCARDKDKLTMLERLDYPIFEYWQACRWRDELRTSVAKAEKSKAAPEQREAQVAKLQRFEAQIQQFEAQGADDYLRSFNISEWTKVIPIKLIESASIYDERANQQWFSQTPEQEPEDPKPEVPDAAGSTSAPKAQ